MHQDFGRISFKSSANSAAIRSCSAVSGQGIRTISVPPFPSSRSTWTARTALPLRVPVVFLTWNSGVIHSVLLSLQPRRTNPAWAANQRIDIDQAPPQPLVALLALGASQQDHAADSAVEKQCSELSSHSQSFFWPRLRQPPRHRPVMPQLGENRSKHNAAHVTTGTAHRAAGRDLLCSQPEPTRRGSPYDWMRKA
jgi:hypothetical protein